MKTRSRKKEDGRRVGDYRGRYSGRAWYSFGCGRRALIRGRLSGEGVRTKESRWSTAFAVDNPQGLR